MSFINFLKVKLSAIYAELLLFLLLSKVKIKTMRDKCLSFFRKISSKEIKTKRNMVDIYKNHQNYKIVTVYQAASGLGIISEPVFFLALDTTAEELSKVILEGLRQSRSISESEEEEIRNNGHKKLLKALKEPSQIFIQKFHKLRHCS